MVGAPRFELGTSCAQGRRNTPTKAHVFRQQSEKSAVSADFGMCVDVASCGAQSAGSLQKSLQRLGRVAVHDERTTGDRTAEVLKPADEEVK